MTTLNYSLAVVGRATVERELASLERRFAQHSRTLSRTVLPGGNTVSRSNTGSVDRSAQKAIREQQRSIDQQLRSKAALHRQRLREEREFAATQSRSNAAQQRAIDRQFRSQQALARQRAAEQREHQRFTNARAEFVRSSIGNGTNRIARTLSGAGTAGAAMLGIGGSALAVSAVNQAMRLDETSRRLSIAGRAPGTRGVDPSVLAREFTQTGIATGFAPEDVANATAAYVAKTGDLDTARKNQRTLATVAQAAGANPLDVFQAAADLSTKLGIKSADEMTAAFAILSQQGKRGAFELKAMASEFPEVLGSAATAGVRGVSGARDVGAMMQIARDTSGSDSEASTAVNAMFRQLAAKSKDIQSGAAFGGNKVSVFEDNDPTKPMRSFVDVLADTISASRGNIVQLQDVFDIRGKKAIDPLITAYQGASAGVLKSGGTKQAAHEAGRAAIQAKFGQYRDVQADFGEVQRDAFDAMKSTTVQLQIGFDQLKDAIGTQLMPEVARLVPQISQLVPAVTDVTKAFVRVASFLANEPFTGLGLAVTAAIVAEIAKAGMARVLTAAVTAAVAGGGLPGIGTTVPGVAGLATGKGMLATGAAAVGVGLAIDQAASFANENGGWEGFKNFIGVGEEKGFGFDAVNAGLDREARAARDLVARAGQDDLGMFKASAGSMFATDKKSIDPKDSGGEQTSRTAVPLDTAPVNAKLDQTTQALDAFNAQLARMSVPQLNRSDKPTGIQN